jgi:hypothetical protein
MTKVKWGHVPGEPMLYIRGHATIRSSITPDMWQEQDRGYTTPCWIGTKRHGLQDWYFKVRIRGRDQLAHRAMYEQEIGPIPEGMTLDHLCRQPPCINPAHLEVVTFHTNRYRSVQNKLTADDVRAIRMSTDSSRELAARFGVGQRHINHLRSGKSWLHAL